MSESTPPTRIVPCPLWLALYLPAFALEVLCRHAEPGAPVAVTAGRGGAERVMACGARAAAAGVHPGMGLSAACALVPELRVLAQDESAERAALEGLSAWAGRFTSFIHPLPSRGLLLEVGGSLGLFGGLDRLLHRACREIAELGYTARSAVAPTPLGAWLLARAGAEARVTGEEALASHLDRVPLECLDLPPASVEALRGAGLRSFGDCRRLPRDGLARRIDPGLPAMLDRALGRTSDPRRCWRPPDFFERRLVLPAPVHEVEALLFAVRRLLLELAGYLGARAGGAQRLEVDLVHVNRRATPMSIGLVAPGRDPDHLLVLLRERLERIHIADPEQAVEEIGLRVRDVGALAPRNRDLFEPESRPGAGWEALVERLRARLGDAAVRGIACAPAHRPERAWRHCAPGESGPVPAYPPRPLWLLAEPRTLDTVDGTPRLGGPLRLRPGAERIETGWWDGHDVTRDYFVASNAAGERFWIFRERCGARGWFLHGVFG